MSRDHLDAFERRHGARQLENGEIPRLTADEKRMFLKALTEKICKLQYDIEHIEGSTNKNYRDTEAYKNVALSQMILMWTFDQVKYGKM